MSGATEPESSISAKIFRPCMYFIPHCNVQNQIYPSENGDYKLGYDEYVTVGRNKTLRVIHMKPIDAKQAFYKHAEQRQSLSGQSLAEEYWFMRWSRPLRLDRCQCSFRKSDRFSKLSDSILSDNGIQLKSDVCRVSVALCHSSKNKLSHFDIPSMEIMNIEKFAEGLMQEIFFKAIQEVILTNAKENIIGGIINFGFNDSKHDIDGVILRQKQYPIYHHTNESATLDVDCNSGNIAIDESVKVKIASKTEYFNTCHHKEDKYNVSKS